MTIRTEISETRRRLDDINDRQQAAMTKTNFSFATAVTTTILMFAIIAGSALVMEAKYAKQDLRDREIITWSK